MKFLIHIFFLLGWVYSLPVYSQLADYVGLLQRYEQEVIYVQGKYYIKGDQSIPFSYISIEKEFISSKEAYPEFLLSVKDRTYSRRSYSLALGLYAGSILLLANGNRENASIPFAGSLVAYGYGIHYSFRSGKRLQHALWIRNRDALIKGRLDSAVLRNRFENETIHWVGEGW